MASQFKEHGLQPTEFKAAVIYWDDASNRKHCFNQAPVQDVLQGCMQSMSENINSQQGNAGEATQNSKRKLYGKA